MYQYILKCLMSNVLQISSYLVEFFILCPRERLRNIVMSTCVCLSARISSEPHARSLPIFCACCLWPWLVAPLTFCSTLCTSSFVDCFMFCFYNGPYNNMNFTMKDQFY